MQLHSELWFLEVKWIFYDMRFDGWTLGWVCKYKKMLLCCQMDSFEQLLSCQDVVSDWDHGKLCLQEAPANFNYLCIHFLFCLWHLQLSKRWWDGFSHQIGFYFSVSVQMYFNSTLIRSVFILISFVISICFCLCTQAVIFFDVTSHIRLHINA